MESIGRLMLAMDELGEDLGSPPEQTQAMKEQARAFVAKRMKEGADEALAVLECMKLMSEAMDNTWGHLKRGFLWKTGA